MSYTLIDSEYNGEDDDDDDDDDIDDDDGAVAALDLVYSQYGRGGRLILTFATTIANTKI